MYIGADQIIRARSANPIPTRTRPHHREGIRTTLPRRRRLLSKANTCQQITLHLRILILVLRTPAHLLRVTTRFYRLIQRPHTPTQTSRRDRYFRPTSIPSPPHPSLRYACRPWLIRAGELAIISPHPTLNRRRSPLLMVLTMSTACGTQEDR